MEQQTQSKTLQTSKDIDLLSYVRRINKAYGKVQLVKDYNLLANKANTMLKKNNDLVEELNVKDRTIKNLTNSNANLNHKLILAQTELSDLKEFKRNKELGESLSNYSDEQNENELHATIKHLTAKCESQAKVIKSLAKCL